MRRVTRYKIRLMLDVMDSTRDALWSLKGGLVAAALSAIVLVSLPGGHAHANPLKPELTISPTELRCDGDSARLVINARQSGIGVRINGLGTVTHHGETAVTMLGETNSAGLWEAKITPPPGTHIVYGFGVDVGDSIESAFIACPFGSDTSKVIAGHAFTDEDADGLPDAGARPVGQVELSISCCTNTFNRHVNVPPHTARTDHDGNVEWTGLADYFVQTGQDGLPTGWLVCMSDQRYMVTSINGSPATVRCATVNAAIGVNNVSFGVRKG